MTAPLRLALLGCADIAARRTLPALLRNPSLRLTALASRTEARAKEFAHDFGGTPVADYQELLEREDVDAVYVCLPSMVHAEWTERALLADKHVLVEKPLATTHADAARLFRLAERRGLVLLENFMFLHHGQHHRVAGLLADGVLGEIRAVSAAFTIPPRPEGDTRYDPAAGGGNGVYPLRAALRFLGPGLTPAGVVLRHSARYGVDVSGAALLHRCDGTPAHIRFGMEHHYRSWYEIQGSAGTLSVDHVFTTTATHPPTLRLTIGTERTNIRLPAEDHFEAILGFFEAAVRGAEGTARPLTVLGRESQEQARLVETLRETSVHVTV
ncbi:Gfo/Idh/MocA family protein [Streptomyces sp. WMMC905]|uniref:Gfo/Idh/MocA family protein n=1 Tax=Streptomyces sp. WMMC905 TaxID=3404123 RepID=UPI003B94AF7A